MLVLKKRSTCRINAQSTTFESRKHKREYWFLFCFINKSIATKMKKTAVLHTRKNVQDVNSPPPHRKMKIVLISSHRKMNTKTAPSATEEDGRGRLRRRLQTKTNMKTASSATDEDHEDCHQPPRKTEEEESLIAIFARVV